MYINTYIFTRRIPMDIFVKREQNIDPSRTHYTGFNFISNIVTYMHVSKGKTN